MKEQTWKRKEYETWDESFRALTPFIRQQSVRVASYARVLYVQACAESYGMQTPEGAARMNAKYAELAYKCGMYHQLGKALVPDEYQIWQNDFTAEEQAVYRKYTTDGRLLVAKLQEKSMRAKVKRLGTDEIPTENIPWLMIREACQQHMEKWNGTGFPDGKMGDEISPIAQIVGLAKELDRLSSETKSEDPFAEAYEALLAEAGKSFSPDLIGVLKSSRAKCRAIYKKYLNYTMTLPKTIPLVDKKKDRPMGLSFTPIIDGVSENVVAYHAVPWFGGLAEDPDEKETIAQIEPQLQRLELVTDMSFYFLYEAADALLRIENCKLALDSVVLEMIPSFYQQSYLEERLEKLWREQPIDKSKFIWTLPESILNTTDKEVLRFIKRLIKSGVALMLDDWHPDKTPLEEIEEYGIKYIRPATEYYLTHEMADILMKLPSKGITVYAKDVDSDDAMRWLGACGVKHMHGVLSGHAVTEDELIRDSILRERDHE